MAERDTLSYPGERPWKGGNTTKGENRRGWRGGRVADPRMAEAKLTHVFIQPDLIAAATMLGEGNFSKGVRRALHAALSRLKVAAADVPTVLEALEHSKIAVELYVGDNKVEARAIAHAARQEMSGEPKTPPPPFPTSGSQRVRRSTHRGGRRPKIPPPTPEMQKLLDEADAEWESRPDLDGIDIDWDDTDEETNS